MEWLARHLISSTCDSWHQQFWLSVFCTIHLVHICFIAHLFIASFYTSHVFSSLLITVTRWVAYYLLKDVATYLSRSRSSHGQLVTYASRHTVNSSQVSTEYNKATNCNYLLIRQVSPTNSAQHRRCNYGKWPYNKTFQALPWSDWRCIWSRRHVIVAQANFSAALWTTVAQ